MDLPDLPRGLTARPLVPTDLDAVYAVYAADEVADAGHLAIEPEDLAGDWARPSFDLATDSIGILEAEQFVAAAEVTRGGTRAEGAVHPAVRGRGLGSWLLRWTESRARTMGATTVGQTTPDGSAAQRLLLTQGYRLGHTSWVLELPEGREVGERPLPAGYSLATGDAVDRERAAYEVIQEAFGEWAGRERESFEDWAATTVRRPGTQPWQLRVVEHDRSVVGASFTILDSQGSGYVHQLAVDRAHRGRGLAQAMLADAFGLARAEGATRSELSTDSRTGALDLYLKVGMEVTQTWTHLVTDLPRG
ncbi:hypothetical protein GCM10023168_15340 [Fodinibacter luteus]|uniref:N-acetyltransferase domain-containing protein n=1 Tax=Fodinibacter luteus TaxID=552064 RepID=A0ABP8KBT5_9MICO